MTMATVITRRSVIGHVRAFTRDDIPAVIRLYEKVYRAATVEPKSAFNAYWENVFLNNPLYDDRAPSLVYEDAEGHIIGFLGIMHRKCTFQQRSCDAAVPTIERSLIQ
jgi:hypothetical protein